MGGQFRVTAGGIDGRPLVVGWDLGVAFEMARALGVPTAAVAEFMPAVESVAIQEVNRKIGGGA
jgi:hypothetical protein